MKKSLLLLFSILSICVGKTYVDSFISCSDADKVYILPEQLMVSHDGIFVLSNDELIPVQAILHDNNGIYYLMPSFYWSCKICGYSNPAWARLCQ